MIATFRMSERLATALNGRAALLAALVLAALPAAAQAAQPASLFNANGQNHVLVCVPPALPSVPLRYGDGLTTGFSLANDLTFNDGRCPPGTVRLDLHEAFPSPGGPLVFHRGGNGYSDEPNTKYGHLLTTELSGPLPETVPSGGGRGAPCAALTAEPPHEVRVESLPEEMHYKHPSELANGSNKGSSFEHYGDPGADQGDRTDISYTYLLWSFVNVRGGGIVRMLLAPGQVVRPCDVEPVTMPSWDREGNENGSVTARYVEARAGTCRVYGWMVWSHDYAGDAEGTVAHAAPGGAVDETTPDAACPVAEGAKPPTIATGDASGAQDGTGTLTGTVHPEGTPTTYRFEYGTTPSYVAATEPRAVSVAMRTNDVSAQIAGLQPSTTYHYRIVAEGEHGSSAGADRTFRTPDPPAPPPPPPPPPPVELTGLQVAPSPLKASRHRLGTSGRITYSLTRPARVTLTFTRAGTGMRVGSKCRTAPRRFPRGRKRCTLWKAVPGSLAQQAVAGTTKVRWGGWLAKRRLAPGRYRVRALPVEAGGPQAAERVAGFRIR